MVGFVAKTLYHFRGRFTRETLTTKAFLCVSACLRMCRSLLRKGLAGYAPGSRFRRVGGAGRGTRGARRVALLQVGFYRPLRTSFLPYGGAFSEFCWIFHPLYTIMGAMFIFEVSLPIALQWFTYIRNDSLFIYLS